MSFALRFPRRFVVLLLATTSVIFLTLIHPSSGQQAPVTPKPGGPVVPLAGTVPADLLSDKTQPFDRITLIDNTSWLIEPVSPRPLPVFDPVAEKAAKKAAAKKNANVPGINPQGNVGVGNAPPANKKVVVDPVSEDMDIHLMEGEIKDFRIKRTSIKKIEYFEDLLMAEADRLIIARDFAKAFEHYLKVKNREPNWSSQIPL